MCTSVFGNCHLTLGYKSTCTKRHVMSPRIATVFGATGLQGSAVVHALLKDGTFTPRAVTRDVNSTSALSLAQLGAEVVAADFGDKEALKNAVAGAEVVFLVTIPTFIASFPEVDQGKNVIDASKEAGVRFMVFSTLPGISDLSKGKYTNAAHGDDKATAQKYLEASGLPSASISTGIFLENLLNKEIIGFSFDKTDDGYVFRTSTHPHSSAVHTWIGHDMGPAVTALFTQYVTRSSEILGQTFVLGSARATFEDFVVQLSKGLGRPVHIQYEKRLGIPAIDDMFDCLVEFPWYAGMYVPDPRLEKLGVKMGTIEEFARSVLKSHVDE